MPLPSYQIVCAPDSAEEIAKLADRTLRIAGAKATLPTPIDELLRGAKIKDESNTEGSIKGFITSLNQQGRAIFAATLQKVRGIADLREQAIYVPADTRTRERFAKAHELGHQKIPWHHIGAAGSVRIYRDDDYSLSPEVKDLFDIEANFFAAEVIFQGKDFTRRARDYRPSFEAVFTLADQHGASRQATLRRYVEEQDELLLALSYLPSRFDIDRQGRSVLRAPRFFPSAKFIQSYGDVQFPTELRSDHPWAEARDLQEICEGDIDLDCGGRRVRFWWQAWWNTYTLLVLLRRRPSLSLVGRILRP